MNTPYPSHNNTPDCNAQVAWMVDKLPPHALVFVISGASQPFWHAMLLQAAPELVATWTVRTSLSEAEAKGWATRATCARTTQPSTCP